MIAVLTLISRTCRFIEKNCIRHFTRPLTDWMLTINSFYLGLTILILITISPPCLLLMLCQFIADKADKALYRLKGGNYVIIGSKKYVPESSPPYEGDDYFIIGSKRYVPKN